MKLTSRLATGIATKWLWVATSSLTGIITVPIMLKAFGGKEGYGLIGLANIILGFQTYLGLGLVGALNREMPVALARNDNELFNRLFNTCLIFYMCLGTLASGAVVLFAPWIVSAANVPFALVPDALFLVRFYAAPSLLFAFVTPVFSAVLFSHNRFALQNLIGVLVLFFRSSALIVVLLLTRSPFAGWAYVMLIFHVLDLLLLSWAAHRVWPALKISLRGFSLGQVPSLFSLGMKIFLLQTIQILGVSTDPIVLTTFLGPGAVAIYTPATQLSGQARPLIDALKQQLDPVASGSFASGRMADLRQILARGTRLRLLMGVAACVIFWTFAEPIMNIWLGKQMSHADILLMASLLRIWSGIHLFTYAAGTQWAVLIGMRRMSFLIKLEVPLAALNLIASIILVGFTKLGVIGVVLPTLVIAIIKRPITAIYAARQVGSTGREYFDSAYRKPLVVLVLMFVCSSIVNLAISPHTLSALLFALGIVAAAWFPISWLFGLDPKDRSALAGLFFSARNKALGICQKN